MPDVDILVSGNSVPLMYVVTLITAQKLCSEGNEVRLFYPLFHGPKNSFASLQSSTKKLCNTDQFSAIATNKYWLF